MLSRSDGDTGFKDLKTLRDEYERSLIIAALTASGGNQRRAAAALGILPTTLFEKMKRLGLRPRPAAAVSGGEADGTTSCPA